MKKLTSHLFHPVLLAGIFFVFSDTGALAQPGNGGPEPVGIPIDGGASLLLAAGAAYGLKKMNDYRKGKRQEPEA